MTQTQESSALGRIVELVRDLRKRCPWDAAQTPETLRPYFVEEALELDHAIAVGDASQIKSELGDVLLHVAFQIALGEESDAFGAEDITRAIETKMWRRHPHLFGEEGTPVDRPPPASPAKSWERQKLRDSAAGKRSIFAGLPPTLPALLMAFRVQERAAGVGFDWPDADGPRKKIDEETKEVDEAVAGKDKREIETELGDLLFAVVNLARKLGCDPRAALEKANQKFVSRFQAVEALAEKRGVELGRANLEKLDTLWDEVKRIAD